MSLITRDLSLSNIILESQNIFHQREKSNQTVAVENNITFSLLRAGTMRLRLYSVGDQIFCSFDILLVAGSFDGDSS